MVGIVSGNGLGLFNSSQDVLGLVLGQSGFGQAKGASYVNVATGNLSIQFLDESLSGTGADLFGLRTYNSLGSLTDGDADGWRWAGERRVALSGTVNTTGSTVTRTLGDGSQTVFSWNGSQYVSSNGSGAHDTVVWNAGGNEWVFTQDGVGVVERYNGSTGWIKNSRDGSGAGFDYVFAGDKLTSIKDVASGQTFEFVYGTNGKLERLDTRTTATGALTRQVYYEYDTYGRLQFVKTDLSPSDNSIADNNFYQTKYSYYGTTNRITRVDQSDGTFVGFVYDNVTGKIKNVMDQGGVTTFTYNSGNTTVANTAGELWTYNYDGSGRLTSYVSTAVNGVSQSATYSYDTQGNVKTVKDGRNNILTYTYDSNGNRTKEYDALGNTITRTFSANSLLLTETRYSIPSLSSPGGTETSRYVYDSANRLRFVISAEGRVSESRYNAQGLLVSTHQYAGASYAVGGLAVTTSLTESQLNTWVSGLTAAQKSQTQVSAFEYDYRGNLSKKTDYATVNTAGTGVLDNATDITEYVYSEHGQLLQTIAVRGTARTSKTVLSSQIYDGMGRLLSVSNENGTITTAYGSLNITVSNTATGLTVVSTTDTYGRLTSVTQTGEATNRISKYYYDTAGRLRMTEDPTGARNYTFYDAAGRVNARVASNGLATVYTHDADGRVLTETSYANQANTATWFDGVKVTKDKFIVGLTSADLQPGQPTPVSTSVSYPVAVKADAGSTNPNMYISFTKLDSPAKTVSKYIFTFYPSGYPGWEDKYTAEYYAQQPRVIIQGNAAVNTTYTAKIQALDINNQIIGETNLFTFRATGGATTNSTPVMTYQKAGPVADPADIIVNNAVNSSNKDRTTQYVYDKAGRLITTNLAGLSSVENTYDGASRLVQSKQGAQITKYYYDKDGRQIGVLNAERYLTENIYDSVGRLTKTIRYPGQVSNTAGDFSAIKSATLAVSVTHVGSDVQLSTNYFYDTQGRLVGVVNEQGFLTETVYDAANNQRKSVSYMTSVVVAGGDTLATLKSRAGTSQITTTNYDAYGRVDSAQAHDGTISRNVYDTAGRLIRQIQAEGTSDQRAVRTRYNAFSEVTGMVSGVGEATLVTSPMAAAVDTAITTYGTRYHIDGAGRKIAELGSSGQKTYLFYNTAGQLTYTVNGLGEVSYTEYNTFGQVTAIYAYSARIAAAGLTGGLDTAITGQINTIASSRITLFTNTYNQFGKLSSVKDAESNFTNYTYDGYGNVATAVQDIVYGSSSTKTAHTYDLLGRVVSITKDADYMKAKTSFVYDGFNRIINSIDANNKNTVTNYLDNGRTITVTDPLSRTSKVEIDAFGRTLKSYDAFNRFTTYTYDDANRKVTIVSPEGISISTTKTRTGETLEVKDGKNGTTKYTYTKDGLLDRVTDAKNIVIQDNDYDASGRLYESKDANGIITRYTYDTANRILQRAVDPSGLNLRTFYEYDAQGRQLNVTEGYGSADAVTTRYKYDRKGQVKQIIVDPSGLQLSTSFTYDGLGNTTKVERGTVASPAQQTTLYTFDQLGRKVLEQQDPAGLNIRTQYKYDANGNLTRLIDANLNSTWFVYDAAGQKTRQIDALGGVTAYEYDKNGRLHHTRQYATVMSTTGLGDVVTSVSLPSTSINDRRSYSVYDNDGRLKYTLTAMSATEWTVSQNVYDANGNVVELWAYDKTITEANVTTITGTGSTEGVLVTAAEVAGLMTGLGYTTTVSGNARVTRYEYDANNRQVKTTLPGWYDPATGKVEAASAAGRFQRTVEVIYDNVGNAVANKIRVGAGTTDYVYQYKAYDAAGREVYDVDALGYVTGKTYNALGQVTFVRRYAGSVGEKTSGYYTPANITAFAVIGSGTSRAIEYRYDKAGRQTQVIQPYTSNAYVAGNITVLTNPATPSTSSAAAVTTYSYDAFGNLTKQSVSNLGFTEDSYFYYDKVNRQIWSVDAEGYGVKTEYDALGNVKVSTEYANRGTGTLGSTSVVPTFTATASDRITQFTYDLLGRTKTASRRINGVMTQVNDTSYTVFGDIKQSLDAQNNLTQFEYNRQGKNTKVIEPGRVIAGAVAAGNDAFKTAVTATPITEFFYDAFGQSYKEVRSTSAGRGASLTIEHTYDLAGNEVSTKDAMSNLSYSGYDVTGRVIRQWQTVTVTGTSTDTNYSHTLERRFEYDKTGRQTAVLDVINGGTQISGQANVYNGYGEVTEERKVWGSLGSTTASLLASATNNVLVNQYVYDTAGRLDYKRSADGYSYFFYDLAGRVTRTEQRETTARTATTRVSETYYDKLGRALVQRLPAFSATSAYQSEVTALFTPVVEQSFDRWGNVLSRSDVARGLNPNGTVKATTYTYNQDNQVLTETNPLVQTTIDYAGSEFSSYTTRKFTYDTLGRLQKEEQFAYNEAGAQINSRTVATNTYNAAGQLTKTVDATNVTQEYIYDAHGNRVGSKDGLGYVTIDDYNAAGQITKRAILRNGATGVYTGTQTTTPTAITLGTYLYDAAGRKYGEADAAGNYQYYKFDERSNIVVDRNRTGGAKSYEFDELNNKTAERLVSSYIPYGSTVPVDTSTDMHRWSYKNGAGTDFIDFQSNLAQTHTVAGNSSLAYTYAYNNFGQLRTETLTGTTVTYDYWENGLLKSITDAKGTASDGITNTSFYMYGKRGPRNVEKHITTINTPSYIAYGGTVVPANSTTTSTTIYNTYDVRGRLVETSSPTSTFKIGTANYATTNLTSLRYRYDEWGNRRQISSTYTIPGGASQTRTEWYAYDAADRVTIEGGISTGSTATAFKNASNASQGIAYSYDGAGRRVKEESWTGSGIPYGGTVVLESYREVSFSYNDLGLLSNTQTRTNTRSQGTNVSGSATYGTFVNQYSYVYDNRGFQTSQVNHSGNRTISSTYNADGNLSYQLTQVTSNGRKEYEQTNYSYDKLGNVRSYTMQAYDTASSGNGKTFNNNYIYTYVDTYTGRQISSIGVTSSQAGTAKGITANSFDHRGRLVASQITEVSATNSSQTGYSYKNFVYNAAGQILAKAEKAFGTSTYKTQNYYYTEKGAELANLGQLKQDISPLTAVYSGGSTPGSYTISAGDTLMGIAQALFGDSSLWYLIADANGLSMGPTDAFAANDIGRNLRIPNSDKVVGNDGTNYKPYNPGEIIGDLTPNPTILPPPKKKGCGVIAQIIMVVVAVVVTIYTAGAAGAYFTAAGSAGAGGFAGGLAVLGGAGGFSAAAIGAAAVGGFVGSVASQAVGVGLGVQDSINFRQAGAAGLTAGFGAAAGAALQGAKAASFLKDAGAANGLSSWGNAAQGAASYMGAYASNKIAGLQTSFNWTDMAVATVSAGITGKTGNSVNNAVGGVGGGLVGNFAGNMFGATVSSSLSRLAGRGEKQDWGAMAADAFGNASASWLVNKLSTPPKADKRTASIAEGGIEKMAKDDPTLGGRFTSDEVAYLARLEKENGGVLPDAIHEKVYGSSSAKSSIDPAVEADMLRVMAKEDRQMEIDALRNDPKALQEFLISKGHTEVGRADGVIGRNTRTGIDNYVNGIDVLGSNLNISISVSSDISNDDFAKALSLNGQINYKDTNKAAALELQSLFGFKGKAADGDFGPSSWMVKEIFDYSPTKETLANIVAAGGDKKQLLKLYNSVQNANANYLSTSELDSLIASNNSYSDASSDYIKAVIAVESRGNAGARNPDSSATGLMQITDPALREYNRVYKTTYTFKDLFSPSINIKIGTGLMSSLSSRGLNIDQVTMRYHGHRDSSINEAYLNKVKAEFKK